MGAPRNTKKKSNGRTSDEWFKASQFSEMIYGGKRFPGGAPAWVPSLVLLLGECKIENREKVAAVVGRHPSMPAHPHAPPSSSSTLLQIMERKYGSALAVDLHRILLAYDAYHEWRSTMDIATPTDAERERVALEAARKGSPSHYRHIDA
eukprot:6203369-Pleurochrysis_carterae.AAC.2